MLRSPGWASLQRVVRRGENFPAPPTRDGRATCGSVIDRRRLPALDLVPRPERAWDASILVVPEIRWGTARRPHHLNTGSVALVGGAEAARALRDQHTGGERVEPGNTEQVRREVRSRPRGRHD